MGVHVRVPVRRHGQIERRGRVRHLHPLCDATEDAGIGLQDIGRLLGDEVPEVPPGRVDFPRRHRHFKSACDLGMTGDVIGRQRFLQPPDVAVLHRPRKADCVMWPAPGVVGVQGEAARRANGLPCGTNPLDVDLEVCSTHLDLEIGESERLVRGDFFPDVVERVARTVVAPGGICRYRVGPAAEKLIERQSSDLAQEIPERGIDCGYGAQRRPPPPGQQHFLVHPSPMAIDESRILAEQRRPERVLYELDGCPASDRSRVGVPDAGMARVGIDPNEDVLPRRELARCDGGGLLDGHTGYNGTNVGNVHVGSSSGSGSRVTVVRACPVPARPARAVESAAAFSCPRIKQAQGTD